jgi:phosphatidylinositol kinase/protein kinase (PI-3  family)
VVREKCEVKNSKKKPIGIVLKSVFGQEVRYFAKMGDDLRQDSFAIQIMKFMNRIWL